MNVQTSKRGLKPFVIGAQKLYLSLPDSVRFAQALQGSLGQRAGSVDVGISPSFINLAHVSNVLRGSRILIGAQNVHQEENGAFTGQVAIRELVELGVQFVIVGHSELRVQQGETNGDVNRKIKTCLGSGVIPVACVGDNREARDRGLSQEVVARELDHQGHGFW